MLRLCAIFVLTVSAACTGISSDAGVTGEVHVIDGDTIDVGGERVRLHGIDAPESWQQCRSEFNTDFDCGDVATAKLREIVEGREVSCVQTDYDARYGRIVARCRVDGVDIGRAMVSLGYAIAYRKYARDYVADERAAARANRGFHAGVMQAPSQARADRRRGRETPAPSARCAIKGNISGNGAIYHMPGQKYYENTRITTSRGERWFCSEAEARAAGWRRSRV